MQTYRQRRSIGATASKLQRGRFLAVITQFHYVLVLRTTYYELNIFPSQKKTRKVLPQRFYTTVRSTGGHKVENGGLATILDVSFFTHPNAPSRTIQRHRGQ